MKIKNIAIPIYGCRLTMILSEDLSKVADKYKLKDVEGFKALVFKDDTKDRHYVVAFTDPSHLSNVAHEIVHIKNHIFLDCAMELDRHNDEPEAYLTGWLFDEIYEFLKQK